MPEGPLVRACIASFGLDLTGLTIFTEAATGAFACTPAIALAAGADRVLALAKDSRHGSRAEAARAVRSLARRVGVEDRLAIVEDHARLEEAHIVTNSGLVRPLSADRVARMRSDAVIPLMYESWEFRPRDLDLGACLERGLLVLGTRESDPRLRSMDEIGFIAAKLLRDAGVAIERARIAVLGGGAFGSSVVRCLTRLGATAIAIVVADQPLPRDIEGVRAFLAEADALVAADYSGDRVLIGPGGLLEVDELVRLNSRLVIAHVVGRVDASELRKAYYCVVPDHVPETPQTMSVTLAHLGPEPVFKLQTAGLKVGEIMARARREATTSADARAFALGDPLCQDFSPLQYDIASRRGAT